MIPYAVYRVFRSEGPFFVPSEWKDRKKATVFATAQAGANG